MAIIKKSNHSDEAPEEPKKGIISGRAAAQPDSARQPAASEPQVTISSSSSELSSSSGKSKKLIIVALFLVTILAGYGLLTSIPTEEKQQQVAFEKEKVELTFDRAVRIYSLVDLLNKRIENSGTALEAAEQRNDDVLVNTLRVTLKQNLSDREEHLEKYAAAILQLDSLYRTENQLFEQAIREYIDNAEAEYKVGRIEAAGQILPILQTMPPDVEASVHIKKVIGLTP